MGPRKTAADYDIFALGRSKVNPRTEAAVAQQTGEPLYGVAPENIPSTGSSPAYMPGDPRLAQNQPPEELMRRRQMLAMQLANPQAPAPAQNREMLMQQLVAGMQGGAAPQGY